MNAKKIFYFSLFIMYCFATSCKTIKPVTQHTKAIQPIEAPIQLQINTPNLLNDSMLNNAHIGICIYEPATNKYIANYQSDKYFIPASNVKIATCYAAMKYLGDSLLGLMYDEKDSSITIKGTGDPTFLHKDFINQPVFEKLKKYKKIYIEKAKFNCTPLGKGWAWDDYEERFMPERSELPLYGNLLLVSLNADTVKVTPQIFKSKIKIIQHKFQSKYAQSKYRNLGTNYIVTDKIELKKNNINIPYTTQDYPYTIDILNDTLHNVSTTFTPGLTDELPQLFNKKIYSQPTDSLLKPMMYNSDNFFAEQTLLMVSLNQLGLMSDEQIIDTLLKKDFYDLPQKPRWVDGSGLSRYNLFTPQDFVFILNKMKTEFSWQKISTIFPTTNQGTLKGYYKNYSNKIFAKTGSISNNFCISGFIKTNLEKEFIFSIMINNNNTSNLNAVRLAIEKYLSNMIENN